MTRIALILVARYGLCVNATIIYQPPPSILAKESCH